MASRQGRRARTGIAHRLGQARRPGVAHFDINVHLPAEEILRFVVLAGSPGDLDIGFDATALRFSVWSNNYGDLNHDGHIDNMDLFLFQLCLTGPAVAATSCCRSSDLALDGEVDLADFAALQVGWPMLEQYPNVGP